MKKGFKIKSKYKPAGDQPEAIEKLVNGLNKNIEHQTLLGVTGSGKTFTMANVIEKTGLPTLMIAHNKTLAAQLCTEFRGFFPDSAVEYFVSYYDYYQPEAYLSGSDTYIEKEAQINDEIERLRHACTQAILSRKDVIIVASVSAIYGLGSPKEYERIVLHLVRGQKMDRRGMLAQLIEMQFERTNSDLKRGTFRMHGQVFEIMPANEEKIYRFEISEKIDKIELIDPITRNIIREQEDAWFFPAKHYVVSSDLRTRALITIRKEADEQLKLFKKQGKVLEYERLKRRVNYDLELIKNLGYCNGIENYSRHFDGRAPGEPPYTLMDYFTHGVGEFLTIIDESHVTVPQIRAMYMGDKARKDNLVDYGFRLPSARDNRPLKFEEFEKRTDKVVYVSATPSEYELNRSGQVVEQIVRPTGLVDPEIIIKPATETAKNISQVDDLMKMVDKKVADGGRILVATLTKKMAEDLSGYLEEKGIKVKYLHSDIKTMERIEIITGLRKGEFDVLVGVNLLREGLDIPEVSLVAVLDADKEGFLRSETSLVQTIGRAARNVDGQVILYADKMTGSMERAIKETERRRKIQLAYNKKHKITPKTIEKEIKNLLEEFGITTKKPSSKKVKKQTLQEKVLDLELLGDDRPLEKIIREKESKMKKAAKELQFELATVLRDEVKLLRDRIKKIN